MEKFKKIINTENVRNLTTENNGLSMTQATSISNRINQRCEDIEAKLNNINNASKTVFLSKEESYELETAKPFPDNYHSLVEELSELRAIQAYLMESIKIKNSLLERTKDIRLSHDDLENILKEEYNLVYTELNEEDLKTFKEISLLKEEDIWSELTETEFNTYIMQQSKAASYGQIIHKNGQLDKLRKELPNLKPLEWIKVKKDEQTPVRVNIHNNMDSLLTYHETFANTHNQIEKSVNYVKAKVKDILNQKNSEIIANNNILKLECDEYNNKIYKERDESLRLYNEKFTYINQAFEKFKLEQLNKISKFKIKIIDDIKEIIEDYNK
jgi:hypothetical protein